MTMCQALATRDASRYQRAQGKGRGGSTGSSPLLVSTQISNFSQIHRTLRFLDRLWTVAADDLDAEFDGITDQLLAEDLGLA